MSIEQVTLTDESTGSSAKILAGFGFNCYSFLAVVDGKPIEALWSEAGFESGQKRASGSGMPILFPFPGRIRGTKLTWNDRQYALKEGDGRGNAIHGFVHERPWRIVQHSPQETTGEFQASVDDPQLLDCWPTDFRITATYRLQGATLAAEFVIDNPGDGQLPLGLGAHPYFRVPLGGGNSDDCIVTLPAAKCWEMVDMIATGNLLPVDEAADLSRGVRFGETSLDNGFSQLTLRDGSCQGSIADPDSGRVMTLRFDDAFRHCVVYNPPHREAICIEPYSCICDPIRLTREGFDAGLQVLEPGEKFTAGFSIAIT